MAKYHVNREGEAGECHASEQGGRGCPFGGAEAHFTTPEAARAAFEETMSQTSLPTVSKKGGTKAIDFDYDNISRADFTAPFALELLEDSGMLHTIKRVDASAKNPADRIVKERLDGTLYIDYDNLAKGHPTFSSSESVLARISASLMGKSVEIDLTHDMARLDMWNKRLVLRALAKASELPI